MIVVPVFDWKIIRMIRKKPTPPMSFDSVLLMVQKNRHTRKMTPRVVNDASLTSSFSFLLFIGCTGLQDLLAGFEAHTILEIYAQ